MGSQLLKTMNVGFMGVGNMGQALIRALISSQTLDGDRIYATNRSAGKLQKVVESFRINPLDTNEELADTCDLIVVAVKPQDFFDAVEPLTSSLSDGKILMSLAAGISIDSIQKIVPSELPIVRVMPNTPTTIQKGVIGYCLAEGSEKIEGIVQDFLRPMGLVIPVSEGDQFEAFTVAASSGPGFIYELMQYWQEWLEEHGFETEVASQIVIETFLGSSLLAAESKISVLDLQDKVVSKKGVTFAGLESMRELEIERALRYSFEKAALRDRELGQVIRNRRKTQV